MKKEDQKVRKHHGQTNEKYSRLLMVVGMHPFLGKSIKIFGQIQIKFYLSQSYKTVSNLKSTSKI
jgi:hypothetical protein